MVWAWGLMRGLDLAGMIPEIDATKNVVIGSSRLGKAALLAAAFDCNPTFTTGKVLVDGRLAICIENVMMMFSLSPCGFA